MARQSSAYLAPDLGAKIEQKNYADFDHAKAFFMVVEQLKAPLTYIARQLETAQSPDEIALIQRTAEANLVLLDSLMVSMRMYSGQADVGLRPVTLGAVLYDVAQILEGYAKQMGCGFELAIHKAKQPVLSNIPGLTLALVNLGYEFISAQTYAEVNKPLVTLAAHSSRHGVRAGLYAAGSGITAATLRRARQLYGTSSQPLPMFTVSNGAGVYLADVLLQTFSGGLRASRHQKQHGLAAFLPTLPQLKIM